MDNYLKDNFSVENLVKIELAAAKDAKWSVGSIIGNNISKVGLGSDGIKPTYYLYNNEKVIRYTKNNHTEYTVKEIKDDLISVNEVEDTFVVTKEQ